MSSSGSQQILSQSQRTSFTAKVQRFYRGNRRSFEWRETRDPYAILVSEIMLQQTQTTRVIEYYRSFIAKYPTFESLAAAQNQDLLAAWVGLGYNRRALFLRDAAIMVVNQHKGRLPNSERELRQLPGVGEYTAAAIQAFAFDVPAILVETNIRTVMILELCKDTEQVSDSHIKALVAETVDSQDPRNWYYALMDYGAHLKHLNPGVNLRAKNYTKQAPFRGSVREIRGAILRSMLAQSKISRRVLLQELTKKYGEISERFDRAVDGLKSDNTIVESERGMLHLA